MLRAILTGILAIILLSGPNSGRAGDEDCVAARPGDGCCDHCGGRSGVRKICRRVDEQKKVTITCWGCDEEDFCVPGCSTPGCEHSEDVCGCSDGCCRSLWVRPFVWTEWTPSDCASIFTRKKLMKRTVTKTVPSYKWVVEDLCSSCRLAGSK
ncbi:MAG: hypothetical protein JNG89_13930 [Planctomycetaceae bacterium]|nr:hypothetical protein [Planctomycetaceae bacterium]